MESSQSNLTTRLIQDPAELAGLGEDYETFLRRVGDWTFFYRPGWLARVWPLHARRPGRRPLIVLALRGEQIIGMLPLQLDPGGPVHAWRRCLHFLGDVEGQFMNWFPELVATPGDLEEAATAIVGALRARARQWDVLELGRLRADSDTPQVLRRLLRGSRQQAEPAAVPVFEFTEGFEAYHGGISKGLRKNLRQVRARLDRENKLLTFRVETTLDTADAEAARSMHARRQRALERAGHADRQALLSDPVEGPAMRELLAWAESVDAVRYYWMHVEGDPVAFKICFHQGQTGFWFLTAMDDDHGRLSPGLMLLMWMFRHECEQFGTRRIWSGPGLGSYKGRVMSRAIEQHQIIAPNPDRLGGRLRHGWVEWAAGMKNRWQKGRSG